MKEYQILSDLIKFNTIKDKENKEIINYIEEFLKKLNFQTIEKSKYLIMQIGKEAKIGFLGHTDTVEYIEGWDSNPFELTKKGNTLYGLGVADMKGGIAAMLQAVSETDFSKLKYGIKLYFTYDEETTFGGIYEIIGKKEKFPSIMIFGEPTDNEILTGSKGILEYKLNFKGIKAHASNPIKGKSANMKAIKFLYELDEFYTEKIKTDIEENFEIPYTTMNVGIINGGSSANSVSAKCDVCLDFRTAKTNHTELLANKVNELSKKYECDINLIEKLPPFINKTELVEQTKTANFLTEASLVENSTKLILGLGPVTAHEINEHITEESYKKLIEQYKEIIQKICK